MLQAYDYWRVLTAHLIYPQSSKTSVAKQNIRINSKPVSDALLNAFEPWLKSSNDKAAAEDHLKSVLHTASETGLLIMSQRSSFVFNWDRPDESRGPPSHVANSVVVMPAFEKTADEHGDALSRHQILVKQKVEEVAIQ